MTSQPEPVKFPLLPSPVPYDTGPEMRALAYAPDRPRQGLDYILAESLMGMDPSEHSRLRKQSRAPSRKSECRRSARK